MYATPEQHELIPKGQPMQGQGYNNPQPMQGQGYNNPQSMQGQGYNNPQPMQGQGYNNPQSMQGQGYNNPQPMQGQGYSNSQPMYGQGYNNPQLMLVQGYNNPQLIAGGQIGLQQPATQIELMPRPAGIPGVASGLEYLSQINQLLIHQQVELLEVLTGWESDNKYQIKNTLGQQVYFAAEESDAFHRQCCGAQRGFIMHITDNMGQEVIRAARDFKCCAGPCKCCACSDCCAQEIRVEAPVGQVIGYARQLQSCTRPCYSVLDAERQEVLYIEGPVCVCGYRDQEFTIMPSDRSQEIGKITKQWGGLMKEMITNADNFSASFPMDLDVRVKATLLGMVFLIDFMYFEQRPQQQNRHHRAL